MNTRARFEKSLCSCLILIFASSSLAQNATPKRVRVSESISRVFLTKRVEPEYPPKAREQGIEGDVVLKVFISPDGTVEDVSVISGDPVLAMAASDAVKQWKYKPYLLNGQPVGVETRATVHFELKRGS